MDRNKPFLLLLILSFISFNSCSSQSQEQKIFSLQRSIVSISIMTGAGEEPNSLGTGFFIGKNRIATAFHVFEDHESEVSGENSTFIARKSSRDELSKFVVPINIVLSDEENDLAIFEFDPNEIKQQWETFRIEELSVTNALPNIGENVTTTGYHNEYDQPSSSLGIISQITEENNIRSDLTILPGMSGSPLLSLKTNKVVGIVNRVSIVKGKQVRLAIAVNSSKLIDLINKLDTQKNIEKLKNDRE